MDSKARQERTARSGIDPSAMVILEQYILAVEMADRVSTRRGQANQFYLTLQSVLLGGPALVGAANGSNTLEPSMTFLLCVVGTVVGCVWFLQLRSYRDLNRAKFTVIGRMESRYFEVQPFNEEWVALQEDSIAGWRGRYTELGLVERIVPLVFIVINVILGIVVWL